MEETRAQRVARMEACFDAVSEAVRGDPHSWHGDPVLGQMWQTLLAYYEDGRWLADFEADERGLLPPELKRGVLSEDGLYDLIQTVTAAWEEL